MLKAFASPAVVKKLCQDFGAWTNEYVLVKSTANESTIS